MKQQSFSNHVRVDPLYHYVAVPLSLLLIPAALVNLYFDFSFSAILLLIASPLLHLAIFFSRDYAKKNQDRIIRAELRLRYYLLTQRRLEEVEKTFSIPQLLAIRFASDDEFVQFLQQPESRLKKPVEIKQQIIEWNADSMRV
ncbi:MAG TPA: DUF6526 family protein [Chryseolinea sp.]